MIRIAISSQGKTTVIFTAGPTEWTPFQMQKYARTHVKSKAAHTQAFACLLEGLSFYALGLGLVRAF
jgi:hypothetical protein